MQMKDTLWGDYAGLDGVYQEVKMDFQIEILCNIHFQQTLFATKAIENYYRHFKTAKNCIRSKTVQKSWRAKIKFARTNIENHNHSPKLSTESIKKKICMYKELSKTTDKKKTKIMKKLSIENEKWKKKWTPKKKIAWFHILDVYFASIVL